jgi:hypothetical protein
MGDHEGGLTGLGRDRHDLVLQRAPRQSVERRERLVHQQDLGHTRCFMPPEDEAMLLADRIVLMTSGPDARVAEIVENGLPRGRTRQYLHRLPSYYALRNHLLDFLVKRPAGKPADPRRPPTLRLGHASNEIYFGKARSPTL